MEWLKEIFANPATVESTLLILAPVIALGLALGSVSFRGVRLSDILVAVGEPEKLQQFVRIVGERASIDVSAIHSQIQVQWITVSRKEIAKCEVAELELSERFGVQLTRIRRSGVELPPMRNVRLHLGDEIRVVGHAEGIARVAAEMGDSPRQLSEPDFLPVFLGITLGVMVGSIPFTLPGIPGAVKLGLAGGPLLSLSCSVVCKESGRLFGICPAPPI